MTSVKLIAASAFAIAATCGVASAQNLPEGRMYLFHSKAQAGCPAIDWHLAVGPNNALTGMFAWNDMKDMAHAVGSADMQKRTFTLKATKDGSPGTSATIDGTIRPDGWLVANIKGTNVNCQGLTVPFYTAPPGGGN